MTSFVNGRLRLRHVNFRASGPLSYSTAAALTWMLAATHRATWGRAPWRHSPVRFGLAVRRRRPGIGTPLGPARSSGGHPPAPARPGDHPAHRGVAPARGRVLVGSLGGRPGPALPIINGLSARLSAGAARRLAGRPARPCGVAQLRAQSQTVSTPVPARGTSLATSFDQSSAPRACGGTAPGQGVGVAVIDTGITGDHPDFQTSHGDSTSRVIASAVIDPNATTASDSYGHGTAVAGLIAGNGGNRDFIRPTVRAATWAAAPGANLISIKVADDSGQCHHARRDLRAAVRRRPQGSIQHPRHQHVVPVHLGRVVHDRSARRGRRAGVVRRDRRSSRRPGTWAPTPTPSPIAPGNDPYVITVGATDDQGTPRSLRRRPGQLVQPGHDPGRGRQARRARPRCAHRHDAGAEQRLRQPVPHLHRRRRLLPGQRHVPGRPARRRRRRGPRSPRIRIGRRTWSRARSSTPPPRSGRRQRAERESGLLGRGRPARRLIRDLTPNSLIDPNTGTIDYSQASWSCRPFGARRPIRWPRAGAPRAGAARAARRRFRQRRPTSASWSNVGWTTMWG